MYYGYREGELVERFSKTITKIDSIIIQYINLRNSNIEYRNPKQTRISNDQNSKHSLEN